ncbi:MAG TPA: roadblock/LC7 domain-containing protein [Ktedonobacterales bacterium]|nr:roadblock/LC7 domain-containing protein [Ktedonobacterales bacterium]
METILQRLMAIDGVTGALLVGKDGLVVASAMNAEDEEMIGAMAAAAYDASGRYIEQLDVGDIRHALFETTRGVVQVSDCGDLLLVVRSSRDANIGRVRIEMLQAGLRLSEQLGTY